MIDNLKGLISEALTSTNPMSVLEIWFPEEIHNLIGLTQGKQHFGDTFEHTKAVVEKTAPDLTLRMAALLHDTGKYQTKVILDDGRMHFHGHEVISAEIAQKLLTELQFNPEFIHNVAFLVRNHMKFQQFGDNIETLSDKALNRVLRNSGENIWRLLQLIDADNKSHANGFSRPNQVHNIILRINANNQAQIRKRKSYKQINK